jgi:hypothetical protein
MCNQLHILKCVQNVMCDNFLLLDGGGSEIVYLHNCGIMSSATVAITTTTVHVGNKTAPQWYETRQPASVTGAMTAV